MSIPIPAFFEIVAIARMIKIDVDNTLAQSKSNKPSQNGDKLIPLLMIVFANGVPQAILSVAVVIPVTIPATIPYCAISIPPYFKYNFILLVLFNKILSIMLPPR
jgi:hypothetical protein